MAQKVDYRAIQSVRLKFYVKVDAQGFTTVIKDEVDTKAAQPVGV